MVSTPAAWGLKLLIVLSEAIRGGVRSSNEPFSLPACVGGLGCGGGRPVLAQ